METFLPVSVKFHIHLTVLQPLTAGFVFLPPTTSVSNLNAGNPAHPCPNEHCQVILQQTLFQKQESAHTGISENGNSHHEICRAVSVCVQGKAFTPSGLPSFEPWEANILWPIFKALN